MFGVDPDRRAIARHSRFCRYLDEISQRCAGEHAGARLVEGLRELAGRARARPILFPTSDAFIEILSPVADELESFCTLSTDLHRHGLEFLSKRRFYSLCRRHHVDLPLTCFLGGEEDLSEAEVGVRYPAILKPVFVHRFRGILGARKVIQVSDPRELRAAYSRLREIDPNFVVQEVIPGGDDQIWCAICYLDRSGHMRSVFVARKLRQYPPGFGSACLAESHWDQEVARLSEDFLTGVDFRGLCATEFKRDARDGRLKMMEVNVRVPLWVGLAPAAGVDIVSACYADLTGGSYAPCEQADGVRWIFAAKDLLSASWYARRRELGLSAWRRSLMQCKAEAVWSRDDPGPAMKLPFQWAAKGLDRLWHSTVLRGLRL